MRKKKELEQRARRQKYLEQQTGNADGVLMSEVGPITPAQLRINVVHEAGHAVVKTRIAYGCEVTTLDLPYILDARDLKLPDVPEDARDGVRPFLAPLLKHVPVENNDCWNIAQKLMLAANSPRVSYVEGVWERQQHHDEHARGECSCEDYQSAGATHAWNTVDGHLVDLSVENKFRGWTPEQAESWPLDWLHEPLKTYTFDDIKKFLTDEIGLGFDGFGITLSIVAEGYATDYGLTFTKNVYDYKSSSDLESDIFKPAYDRLKARLALSLEKAVA